MMNMLPSAPISFLPFSPFGGGVGGGAAKIWKGNGCGMYARSGSGARPEAQYSNAYASRSHHHALRAWESVGIVAKMGSSKGKYFTANRNFAF